MDAQGRPLAPHAVAHGWHDLADADLGPALAELGKVLGPEEASKPAWQRRLVRLGDGQLALTYRECAYLSTTAGFYNCPWHVPGSLAATEVAAPVAEVVALLRSDANPERELQRRRKLADEHEAKEASEREGKARRDAEEAARARQAQENEVRYRERDWRELMDWQRALYAVAVRVEARDPELAADLRAVAGASTATSGEFCTPLPRPDCKWWG
jgi:hypothetical protein